MKLSYIKGNSLGSSDFILLTLFFTDKLDPLMQRWIQNMLRLNILQKYHFERCFFF